MTCPQEEYSKWYIVQALFKLMNEYEFEKISVTEIVKKAGVGRATFYRSFKRKEDVLLYYFEHHTKSFVLDQKFFPRCKEDYLAVVESVLAFFKEQIQPFKLIRKARLEYIYLNYLNQTFEHTFKNNYAIRSTYLPHLYSGMLFNVSMRWLDNDCEEDIPSLAKLIINAIYFD